MSGVTVCGGTGARTPGAPEHSETRGAGHEDRDPDALAWVEAHEGGKREPRTMRVGGHILSVPAPDSLDRVLGRSATRR